MLITRQSRQSRLGIETFLVSRRMPAASATRATILDPLMEHLGAVRLLPCLAMGTARHRAMAPIGDVVLGKVAK